MHFFLAAHGAKVFLRFQHASSKQWLSSWQAVGQQHLSKRSPVLLDNPGNFNPRRKRSGGYATEHYKGFKRHGDLADLSVLTQLSYRPSIYFQDNVSA